MRTKGIGPRNLGMSKSPAKMMASPAKKDPPLTPAERAAKNKIDGAATRNNMENVRTHQDAIVKEAKKSSDGNENYVRQNVAGKRNTRREFEAQGVKPIDDTNTKFARERVMANANVNAKNRKLGKETVVETEKYFSSDATVKNKKAPRIATKKPKMKLR